MQTKLQASLLPYNTFGIDARVDELIFIEKIGDIHYLKDKIQNGLIIGGGSNILLSKPRYPLAFINQIKGVVIDQEQDDTIDISVGSGENWHELVVWALSHNFGGLENLSLIPGTVGAAPIQNIGAYGVEIKNVLLGVDFLRYEDHTSEFISVEQCLLQYRDSIFKNEWKNKGLITKVYLRLSKKFHTIHSDYNALKHYLAKRNWDEPTIHQISQAVIDIRKSKLPDWRELGNAGSFFKNPVVSRSFFNDISTNYPHIPSYDIDPHHVKIPAAWLIQEAGFKGIRKGPVGTYPFQPLVLIHYGGGTADDILKLKDEIQEEIWNRFGIWLVPEVTIL